MSATYNKFNAFVADIHNKVHNLGSDTLKVMLSNAAPSASNSVKADITEISAGNGYSAGGMTVTVTSSTQTSGTYKLMANATQLTASGSVGPFRYAVLYNSTPVAGNLMGWLDYGSSVNLNSSDVFTITWDGTNGIFSCV